MIAVTTPDQIQHLLPDAAAIATYSTDPTTIALVQAAYDTGNWVELPAAVAIAPDWSTFRIVLMTSTTFRAWAATLPDDWREDLKLVAIAANLEALQAIYNNLKQQHMPGLDSIAEWQAIADANGIAVVF